MPDRREVRADEIKGVGGKKDVHLRPTFHFNKLKFSLENYGVHLNMTYPLYTISLKQFWLENFEELAY